MQPLNETLLNLWFESSEEQAAYAEHRGGRGMKHVRLRDFSIHQDKVNLLEAVPRPTDVPVMPDKVGLSDKVTSSASIFQSMRISRMHGCAGMPEQGSSARLRLCL